MRTAPGIDVRKAIMTYRLHYAPDNASLVIRMALDTMGLPFETELVDRANQAQLSMSYQALNPNGLIPVLETPYGPMFETAAILLWLADTHDQMVPSAGDSRRGLFLKWLFFLSNTLHADLRILFYPAAYIGSDETAQTALRAGVTARLVKHLTILDTAASGPDWYPGVQDIYLAAQLRWMAIYPRDYDRSWFNLAAYPTLQTICTRIESLPATYRLQIAEGLGPKPFTAPQPCNPPEGSAL